MSRIYGKPEETVPGQVEVKIRVTAVLKSMSLEEKLRASTQSATRRTDRAARRRSGSADRVDPPHPREADGVAESQVPRA